MAPKAIKPKSTIHPASAAVAVDHPRLRTMQYATGARAEPAAAETARSSTYGVDGPSTVPISANWSGSSVSLKPQF